MENCPNCNKPIKDKLFSTNQLIKESKTKIINTFSDKNAAAYCGSCVDEPMQIANKNITAMKKEIERAYRNYVFSLPVLTLDNPKDWDYTIMKLMSYTISVGSSAQDKIIGERLCIEKLQIKLLKAGGNAIIGTRMQYALSDNKQTFSNRILSVYGTAVKVKNTDSVFSKTHHIAAATYFKFDDSRRLLKSFNLL